MSNYLVYAWKLSDFSGALSTSGNATDTTGNFAVGTSTTLAANAQTMSFVITDDDDTLDDAYVEASGNLSCLANDLVIDGVTFSAGQNIEAEFQLLTTDNPSLTFIVGRIGSGTSNSGENLVVFTTSPIHPNQTYTFNAVIDGEAQPYQTICYARGTLIDTPHGPIPVQMLLAGDAVLTRDNGVEPISWIGSRNLTSFELMRHPELRPIRIKANALGPNQPDQDLIVSPQHRILVSDWRAELLYGEREVLIPAKSFVNGNDVVIDALQTGVEYFHILLEDHQLLSANGQWAESLYPGEEALETLSDAQKLEIEQTHPDFFSTKTNTCRPVCPIISITAGAAIAA